ncbi:MAG: OmpA family protein [bacterium]
MNTRKYISAYGLLIILAGSLVAGCATQKQLEVKQNYIEELRTKNKSLKKKVKSLQSKLERRNEKLARARNQTDTQTYKQEKQRKKIKKLRKQLKKIKEKRIQKLAKRNKQLQKDLQSIKEGRTRREGKNVIVSLDSKILFPLGEATLKPKARETLNKIASILKKYPERRVVVEGHTDTVPVHPESHYEDNWLLSAARAVSVVRYLTETHSLPPKRFTAAGYGEHKPLKPNTTKQNRQLNRRVEIVLFPPELTMKTLSTDNIPE